MKTLMNRYNYVLYKKKFLSFKMYISLYHIAFLFAFFCVFYIILQLSFNYHNRYM